MGVWALPLGCLRLGPVSTRIPSVTWLQLGSGLSQYVRISAILAAAGAWGMVSSSFDQAE